MLPNSIRVEWGPFRSINVPKAEGKVTVKDVLSRDDVIGALALPEKFRVYKDGGLPLSLDTELIGGETLKINATPRCFC